MDDIFRELQSTFYTPPKLKELKQAIEANYRLLIERLDQPERKLVLRIMDDKDQICEDVSLDSFICGFRLAWQITNQI